jgi:hypothetical protein
MALLVGEGHLTDGPDPGLDGVALGHVNGPEHAHFQIGSGISHELWFLGCPCRHFAGNGMVFHSRRRRYRTDRGRGDGIIVLSLARNPAPKKRGRGNAATKELAA